MGDKVTVRIPVLENVATQYGHAFATHKRKLNTEELAIGSSVYRQSVALEQVWIVTTGAINAPTTLGNNIRVSKDVYFLRDEYWKSVLVHELMHIWQYQTQGKSYISDSAFRQSVSAVAGFFTGGDRSGAYTYTIEKGKSIYTYTAEQQGQIMQDYYLSKSSDPDYIKLVEEVRKARPVLTDADRYMESLYGAGYANPHFMDPVPGAHTLAPTNIAPIIRIEF
jgi:hypothetical protein